MTTNPDDKTIKLKQLLNEHYIQKLKTAQLYSEYIDAFKKETEIEKSIQEEEFNILISKQANKS